MNLSNAIREGVMTLRAKRKLQPLTPQAYATLAHFCRVFREDMHSLYLLAFLLTANHAHAERCFVSAFEAAVNDKGIFAERARYWSRRAVIKEALRVIAPVVPQSHEHPQRWDVTGDGSTMCMTINALTQLPTRERSVFVMCVLEGYSEKGCATFLDLSPKDIREFRIRALRQLPTFFPALLPAIIDNHHRTGPPDHERNGS